MGEQGVVAVRRRSLVVVAGVSVMAASLAGCSGHATASRTTRPGGGSPTTTDRAVVGRCHSSALTASLTGSVQTSPGQFQLALVYTNHSTSPCTLSGFPGFAVEHGAASSPTTYSPPRQGVPDPSFTVAPGAAAHAFFRYDESPAPCAASGAGVTPSGVVTIPPDETAPLSVPWVGGAIDICTDTSPFAPSGSSIGPVEPGAAPTPPSPATLRDAEGAADSLTASLGPTTPDRPSWGSSGVVQNGSDLWLAVASRPSPASDQVSVTVDRWTGGLWASQATLPLPQGFPGLNGGVGAGSVLAASLTGSGDPDFAVQGTGADWLAVVVLSDAGGTWHAVTMEGASPATLIPYGTIVGNVVGGGFDLCGCAANPSAFNWFQYENGTFRPAEPPGPAPTCTSQALAAPANAAGAEYWPPGASEQSSQVAVPQPLVLASVACRDGWALAEGTASGSAVVVLFNWKVSYGAAEDHAAWVVEDAGTAAEVAKASASYTVPPVVYDALATRIGVPPQPAASAG